MSYKTRKAFDIRLLLLLICFVQPYVLSGQKYHLSFYNTDHGLLSNQVRHVIQDSFGLMWIATDAGIARFDGRTFEPFPGITPSKYTRHFCHGDGEEILVSHDVGVSRFLPGIVPDPFEVLIEGEPHSDKALVHYPNTLFRDHTGTVWIGQPDGRVTSWQGDSAIQYQLPGVKPSSSSTSEIHFLETPNQVLWAASEDGKVFCYDREKSTFLLRRDFESPIHAFIMHGDNALVGGDGLTYLTLNATQTKISRAQKVPLQQNDTITALLVEPLGMVLVGTKNNGVFGLDTENGRFQLFRIYSNNDPHRVNMLPFRRIYNLLNGPEQTIWICAQEGLGILRNLFFETVTNLANDNTLSIEALPDASLVVSFGRLYRVEKGDFGYEASPFPSLNRGSVNAIVSDGNTIWGGTGDGEILKMDISGRLLETVDLTSRGAGIFYMERDRRGVLWICQAPDQSPIVGVAARLPDGTIKEYGQEAGLTKRILVVKESPEGRLYAAGIGPSTYLYLYRPEEDRFMNLSLPLDFIYRANFEVHDFTVDEKGVIWLASTDGLLRYDLERIHKIDLGPDYKDVEIRAVTRGVNGAIWISTDTKGILHYREDQLINLREQSGLPSKIMAYRLLKTDRNGRLWAGTAEGLVYSLEFNPEPDPSRQPFLEHIVINGLEVPVPMDKKLSVSTRDILQLTFATPAYHGFDVSLQYRIGDGEWLQAQDPRVFRIEELPENTSSLAFRAMQEGGFEWSAPYIVDLAVHKPWIERDWLKYAIAGILLLIVMIGFRTNARRYLSEIGKLRKELESRKTVLARRETEIHEKAEILKQTRMDLESTRGNFKEDKSSLIIVRSLIEKLHPGIKWDFALEALSLDLMRMPGVMAFEIGILEGNGKTIFFEGFTKLTDSFTRHTQPFDRETSLAAYCISTFKPLIIRDMATETMALLGHQDKRAEIYQSMIMIPFYMEQTQKATLAVYAQQKQFFDENDMYILNILTAYLEQIS